jgi:hypothetical protein
LATLDTSFVATLSNDADDATDSTNLLLRIKSELVDPLGAMKNWSPTTHVCK